MKIKLILILCILSFGVLNAQNLSISDLTNICGKSTYEQAATILTQKGWAFYKTETGRWFDGSAYRCTIWSHSRDEWEGNKAQAWFHIYCYNNKVCAINYQMFDDKQYARMESQMAGTGFKFQKTEYRDNSPIMSYSNNLFYITIRNSRDDVANYGNRYTFELIKKGSQADTKNGNKEEDYGGKTFKYHLKDGYWDGLCNVYYSNGQLLMTANYVKGEISGIYKKYDYEGHLIYNGTLHDRKFTGAVKEYDEDGHIVREGNATNLHILSRSVNIYKSGASDQFVTDITFRNDENFTGTIRKYYDGELIREGKMSNGKFTGWAEKQCIERQIGETIEDFSESQANAEYGALIMYIALHGDTIPLYTTKITYVNNKPHGEIKTYDEQKRVMYIQKYQNGMKVGDFQRFDENGNLFMKGSYNNENEFSGTIWGYDDGGILIAEAAVRNDVLHGERKQFYPNGKLKRIETFVEDELDGTYREYLENGTLVSDGTMHNGKFTGMKKIYYDGDTSIALIFNLREDLFHGHITAFNEKGEIVKEGDFIAGEGSFVMKDSLNRTIRIEPIINNLEHGDEIHYTYNTDNSIAEIAITEYESGEETGNAQIISRDTMVEMSENGNLLTLYVTEDSSFTENYQSKTWTKMHAISLKNGKKNGIEWICYPQEDCYDYVECNYKDGIREGDYKVYTNTRNDFKSAKLRYSFRYIAGKPHGNYYNYGKDSTFISKKFDHGQITYCMMPFNTDAMPDDSFIAYQIKFERFEDKNHWQRTFYFKDSIVEQTLHFFMEYPYTIMSFTSPSDYCYDTYTPDIFYFPLSDDICNESTYPDGDYHCIYQDGTKDIRGQYYKQDKIGEWTILYPKQSIKQVIFYGTNSEPLSEMFYTLSGQLFSGEFVEDLSDDTYMICPIKKGVRHGKAKICSKATRMVIEKKKY